MTIRDVLNLMDHEVWVRIRVNDGREDDQANDLVLWSADWIGGGEDDPGMPDGLKDVLDWDGDDLLVEMYDDPEFRGIPGPEDQVPMIVVNARDLVQRRTTAEKGSRHEGKGEVPRHRVRALRAEL